MTACNWGIIDIGSSGPLINHLEEQGSIYIVLKVSSDCLRNGLEFLLYRLMSVNTKRP
jgi:hypothetical protein